MIMILILLLLLAVIAVFRYSSPREGMTYQPLDGVSTPQLGAYLPRRSNEVYLPHEGRVHLPTPTYLPHPVLNYQRNYDEGIYPATPGDPIRIPNIAGPVGRESFEALPVNQFGNANNYLPGMKGVINSPAMVGTHIDLSGKGGCTPLIH